MGEEGPQPSMGLLVKAGPESADLTQKLRSLLEEAGEMPVRLSVQHRDGVVVLATGPTAARAGDAQAALRIDRDFRRVIQRVAKRPAACVYVDIESLVRMAGDILGAQGPPAGAMWPAVREALGLDGLCNFVWTADFQQRRWVTQAFLELPPLRRGLAVLFDMPLLEPSAVGTLPGGSRFATVRRFDVAKIFDQMRLAVGRVQPDGEEKFDAAVHQISTVLGMDLRADLLGSVGDTWATFVDPPLGGTNQAGMVLRVGLRDAVKIRNALDRIGVLANGMLAAKSGGDGQPVMRIRQFDRGSLKVHYLGTPFLSPAWAVHGQDLYVALYPQVVVAATSDGRGGDVRSLDKDPKFKAAWQALGVRGASAIAYSDLPPPPEAATPCS